MNTRGSANFHPRAYSFPDRGDLGLGVTVVQAVSVQAGSVQVVLGHVVAAAFNGLR